VQESEFKPQYCQTRWRTGSEAERLTIAVVWVKDGGNQSSGYENKESKLNIRTWNKQDLIILSLLGLSL
jgi:hypothetical protein